MRDDLYCNSSAIVEALSEKPTVLLKTVDHVLRRDVKLLQAD